MTEDGFAKAIACAYTEAGREHDARLILERLNESATERFVTPYHRAIVHLRMGEHDEALKLLEQSIAVGDPWFVWLATEPQLDPLREDPRFVQLLRRTGIPLAS